MAEQFTTRNIGPSLGQSSPAASSSDQFTTRNIAPSLTNHDVADPVGDWDAWHQMVDAAVFGRYSKGSKELKENKAAWEKQHPGKAEASDLVGRAVPMMAIGAAASLLLPEAAGAVGLAGLGRFLAGTFGKNAVERMASFAAAGGWQGALGAQINNLVGANPHESVGGSAIAGGLGGVVGQALTAPLRSGILPSVATAARNYMQSGMRLTPAQVPGAPRAVRFVGGIGSLFGLGSKDLPRLTGSLMRSIGAEGEEFTDAGVTRAINNINARLAQARQAGDLQGVRLATSQLENAGIVGDLARSSPNGVVDTAALARAVSARNGLANTQSLGALGQGVNPVNIEHLATGGELFARGTPGRNISNLLRDPRAIPASIIGGFLGPSAPHWISEGMEYMPHGVAEGAAALGGTTMGVYGGMGSLMNNPLYMRALLSKYLPTVNPMVSPFQQTMGNQPMGNFVGSANAMTSAKVDQSGWEDYIRAAAAKRGIDPDTAVKVARTEGLGDSYAGDEGSSFGPYQLHYGGMAGGGNRVGGLGDEFTKATGLHARDPATVPQQIDFALDYARANGWGPWHGWKGDQFAGIPRGVQVSPGPTASPWTDVTNPLTADTGSQGGP